MNYHEVDAAKRKLRAMKAEYEETEVKLENMVREIKALEASQKTRQAEIRKLFFSLRAAICEEQGVPDDTQESRPSEERYQYQQQPPPTSWPPIFANVLEADLLTIERYTPEEVGAARSALSAITLLQQRVQHGCGALEQSEAVVAFVAHKLRVAWEDGHRTARP
jgi:hypothetical protein